jgi:nicotinate phosphoribosyltransferase
VARIIQPCIDESALLTDLYQLTMLQAYFRHGMTAVAVFEFFVRKLPSHRSFLMAAGLQHVLDYLEGLRFTEDELQWLAARRQFQPDFIEYLASLRFTGDVWAMPEGTIFFADEPILRVVAPLPEAQLVESRIINLLQFPTLIASKAARCVLVAPNKLLVDFGFRRAHGAEAGLLAARAAYLAGFSGTATVQAGRLFDIPLYGTMAHSFIQAHADEVQAFLDFAAANPSSLVFLIDTYDTEAAARKVVQLVPRLQAQGLAVRGVRIDSGDLADHARRVRRILDEANLGGISIFASGGLDEYSLRDLLNAGAPIDGFGIGSRLDVSADVPYLDCAYKLQEYAGIARRKRSEGKATWPGRKQVYRRFQNGIMVGDCVTLEEDRQPGVPLLEHVMAGGRRLRPSPDLRQVRQQALENLAQLPQSLRSLDAPCDYPVEIAPSLRALADACDRRAS